MKPQAAILTEGFAKLLPHIDANHRFAFRA
jgi:hypothetical protein